MRKLAIATLTGLLAVAPTRAEARDVDYGGLAGGRSLGLSDGTGPSARDPEENPDRAAIQLLARHLVQVNAEIDSATRFQRSLLEEAKTREEATRRRLAAAEQARRKANQRAARNALIELLGVASGADVSADLELMNSLDDLADAVTAQTDEERADVARRALYTPLLVGDDPAVRDLDNALVAMREHGKVVSLSTELEAARERMRQAQVKAEDIDGYLQDLEFERERTLARLDAYAEEYLRDVRTLMAEVPGFTREFGSVEDLAFDLDQALDSRAPLIGVVTFHLPVAGRDRPEVVDVPLSTLRTYLADGFASLVLDRRAAVRVLEGRSSGPGYTERLAEAQALLARARAAQDSLGRLERRALERALTAVEGMI